MKFPISNFQFPISRSAGSSSAPRRCPIGNRQLAIGNARAGMALVITLIMLAVTLVMAVAFLAIARRERNAVTTTTDTATARLATDVALAAAQAQVAANILTTTNLGAFNFNLLVSTNYINAAGFAGGSSNPTNVNYDYYNDAVHSPAFATLADRNLNIANLYLFPRAPVFIRNPNNGLMDFRFWLDVNQNRIFEGNGPQPQIDSAGFFIHTDGTVDSANPVNVATNFMVGDPEWVGVLERPDQPHGPNNHFVARYAFLAQPIGNSLDLNFIHNQTLNTTLNVQDGFFRNQGVGSWELNLAAFLADLNTNEWAPVLLPDNNYYAYNEPGGNFNQGRAFDDARAVLSWRYNFNYGSLFTANQSLNFNAINVFPYDTIDAYGDGSLQTTVDTNADFPQMSAGGDWHADTVSWAGSDNTNRFFSILSDVFGGNNFLGNFPAHLQATGSGTSTYDRYTLYRLLDQLGTDSTADAGKLNLNYSNAVVQYDLNGMVTNIAIIEGAETNLMPWAATNFFHAAANQLLRTYSANWLASASYSNHFDYTNTFGATTTNAFGITNIPVYVNGQFVYTPAVNRLLQLAANIYDAGNTNWYPTVFRPVLQLDNARNLFIVSYQQVAGVSGIGDAQFSAPYNVEALTNYVSLNTPIKDGSGPVNAYGVPWIIGAKKGLPNFQMLSMVNAAQVTRKLQVSRDSTNVTKATYWTNQMYVMSITNNISFSFWNSYSAGYTNHGGQISVYASDRLDMVLTNGAKTWFSLPNLQYVLSTNFAVWPGSQWDTSQNPAPIGSGGNSFIAANWSYPFLPQSIYRFNNADFDLVGSPTSPLWETTTPALPPLPQFGLQTTNRFQGIILDGTHVIDYVQLRGPNNNRNLSTELADFDYPHGDNIRYQWSTNEVKKLPPTWGVLNQLAVSGQSSLAKSLSPKAWSRPPTMPSSIPSDPNNAGRVESEFFGGFFTASFFDYYLNKTYVNVSTNVQAPYTPMRTIYDYTLWQANDPLVHYLASDLAFASGGKTSAGFPIGLQHDDGDSGTPSASYFDYRMGDRYQPWGRNVQMTTFSGVDTNAYNRAYKDSLAWGSDYWDFPANPLPTVGWLGRVHRGTPWQTVFLKSGDILQRVIGNQNVGTNTWAKWTGDTAQTAAGKYFDAVNSAPVQDRQLFDLFTTRFDDNAARGTLSVNQTHLAAWSAVFGGMVVLSNSTAINSSSIVPPVTTYFTIDPAGVAGASSVLGQLVNGAQGINAMRSTYTNADGLVGTFEHTGDILSVPALTEQSPFLNMNDVNQLQYGISDAMYEWLPQQALGLLRANSTPRYVIYCYGQTLRPAANSLVTTSGNDFGLCTNYQITAESAARAVIRVDNATTKTPRVVVESFNPLPPN